jgi:hypothetical protein
MKEFRQTVRSIVKAFVQYKAGFKYLYYRYIVAPRIFMNGSLEKPVTHENFSIHMLTSHQDFLIAMWSLGSFFATSKVIGHLTIHNDGTLTQEDQKVIQRLFPHARVVNVNNFLEEHASKLIAYPTLLDFRRTYKRFQSKKLLDVFFERQGDIILYLDSDLLWFKNSKEISEAVERGAQEVSYMMSNGSERVHVEFKDGTRTSDFIAECNSGATLFNVKNYDLQRLVSYIEKCDYLNKKFTDQACFGTVLEHVEILPRDKYFIKGGITDETVMRHYTGPSREKFFFYGINKIYKDMLMQARPYLEKK